MKEKDILQAAIILLIIVSLANALIPFVKGTEKPLIVLSGSMVPVMMPGDMVVAKSVDPNEFKVGDVMIFHPPGADPNMLITHRIISIEEGENRIFQTKGDANGDQDFFKVPASNTVGKSIFVIPFAGYLPDLTKRYRSAFLLTVILPACLLIFGEIKNVILYSNPARARKVEKERKKAARRTHYKIKGKRLVTLILISGLIFTGIVEYNLGNNGPVTLGGENTIKNPGFLSQVFIFMPDNSEQMLSIHPWYGVVPPANRTQVTAPENTPAKISSVPYILPVFWIIMLAEINPYLPAIAEIAIYTSAFILLFFPIWYRKSTVGGRRKKTTFKRKFAKWKRTLHIG